MNDVDTSAEAVERLARPLASLPFNMTVADFDRAAATLRALLAERDRLSGVTAELRAMLAASPLGGPGHE